MERSLAAISDLSESEIALAVEIAKSQARLLGGTENYIVTREFRAISTPEQRGQLLRITSYNVCYTKLLRHLLVVLCAAPLAARAQEPGETAAKSQNAAVGSQAEDPAIAAIDAFIAKERNNFV